LYKFKGLRPSKKIVANELRDKEFDSVLEVGTQWGESLLAVKEVFPDKRLVGIDIDKKVIEDAKEITGLDLRYQDALTMPFKPNEFDVVFTSAFFCMLPIIRVDSALRKVIQTAKKYIILVELTRPAGIGVVFGKDGKQRIGVCWKEIFDKYGLKAETKPIPKGIWDENPWGLYGQIITVKI